MSDKYKDIENAFKSWIKRAVVEDKVPDGYWNTEDYMAAYNLSMSSAHRHIKCFVKENLVESKSFKIKTGSRVYPVPHFKFLKKKDTCKASPKQKKAS